MPWSWCRVGTKPLPVIGRPRRDRSTQKKNRKHNRRSR